MEISFALSLAHTVCVSKFEMHLSFVVVYKFNAKQSGNVDTVGG